MREIDGKGKTVRELLDNTKYSIDFYQRDYEWGKKQVQELIDDLTQNFLEDYEVGHERSEVAKYGHYFLGSIISNLGEKGGFVTKVLEWARTQEVMRVVDDQISSPTSARMLAEITALILAQGRDDVFGYLKEKGGLYHCAGGGSCSRYEWAKAILDRDPHKEEQTMKVLETVKSIEFPTAQRPLVSVMNCTRLERIFSVKPPNWQTALGLGNGS